eukprot:2831665-Lingulodinium_polyedra.AAC.1
MLPSAVGFSWGHPRGGAVVAEPSASSSECVREIAAFGVGYTASLPRRQRRQRVVVSEQVGALSTESPSVAMGRAQ